MSLYKQYATDQNLEKIGILLSYGPDMLGTPNAEGVYPEICIRIARAGGSNTEYQKQLDHAVKPVRRQIQQELLGLDKIKALTQKVYARCVVLGWENVRDADGNLLDFNEDNVLKVFQDLPDLWEDVQEQATRAALFRKSIQEDDAGN